MSDKPWDGKTERRRGPRMKFGENGPEKVPLVGPAAPFGRAITDGSEEALQFLGPHDLGDVHDRFPPLEGVVDQTENAIQKIGEAKARGE